MKDQFVYLLSLDEAFNMVMHVVDLMMQIVLVFLPFAKYNIFTSVMAIKAETTSILQSFLWNNIDWLYFIDIISTAINAANLLFAHTSLLASLYYAYIYTALQDENAVA